MNGPQENTKDRIFLCTTFLNNIFEPNFLDSQFFCTRKLYDPKIFSLKIFRHKIFLDPHTFFFTKNPKLFLAKNILDENAEVLRFWEIQMDGKGTGKHFHLYLYQSVLPQAVALFFCSYPVCDLYCSYFPVTSLDILLEYKQQEEL